MNQNNSEEILKDAIRKNRRTKRQKRIMKFNPADGITSEVEDNQIHVSGQGIVKGIRETDIVLDCGHSSKLGIGHVAHCKHTACQLCVDNLNLTCAHPGCFRKLCTVQGCPNCARMMAGVYTCKRHQFGMFFDALSNVLLWGPRKTQIWMDQNKQEYYSRPLPEKRKEVPYEKQRIPRQPNRDYGIVEKDGYSQ